MGCNVPLWKSSVTQEPVNIAQKAHIHAFAKQGPRANPELDIVDLNGFGNLMLVCYACHRKLDDKRDGGMYPDETLRAMKRAHERRIEVATGIDVERRTHILLYGANIGDQSPTLAYRHTAPVVLARRYLATDQAIELGLVHKDSSERDTTFWSVEAENLRRRFARLVKERQDESGINHLSVFALAPQPLLILLGTLLGDIVECDIYQRHREPSTWSWPESNSVPAFLLTEPADSSGKAVLLLALSATVTRDRIERVLGADINLWQVTIPAPHNDMLKSPEQLASFRALLRGALDRIKARHGQSETLHIFPAAPVSVCVELGRIRMPKADMPWKIYDQVNALGGFVPTIHIS